ncbi:hypothetical protein NDU88_002965 [Pleurodeles waltl]|uniref:Uncharacterized protein n=1 Tax=Pleurodeles waltl TaxID=8319 RepID=A0AAV7UX57_PLEWA|nr:hypothetical protein NDU88_002965 [Pleurodeles waltl]
MDRACCRRPQRVAVELHGAAGCAAAGRHPEATRRLSGPTSEQQRVLNLATEVLKRNGGAVGLRGSHFFAGPLRGGGPELDTAQHCIFAPLLQVGGARTGARGSGHPSALRCGRPAVAQPECRRSLGPVTDL